MAPVIERAEQLILNYVSRAADAAHGVLRSHERLDFTRRLRARIEQERGGSQNPREVARLLARFGDPAALVAREARRLAELRGAPPASPGVPAGSPAKAATVVFPAVRDLPPGVSKGLARARGGLARRPGRGMPFAGLRRAAMESANPMSTEGRDAATIVKEQPRDALALGILVLAALLIPFELPAIAIFRIPVLIWGIGAVLVMASDSWVIKDRVIGVGAPIFGYAVGGVVVGGLRAGGAGGFEGFVAEFFAVSGVMFMIGAVLGVMVLAYRLLNVS
ncbi:hypothetical protein OIE66_00225 [Nonomuraea sp. NBC_01738]|uniref:hypothetical protein n=1 Tax=Nonomuraea sp. NBC_01738 TaxID=2976003 RepID=UPI002E1326E6|nr:hypothetical protein OIE66_00225 [Nonomuraea sp. NBC_01738]